MGEMHADPERENHARQTIWDFLLQHTSRDGRSRCYLVSYPRSGNTLVRSYFALLQGRPQLSVYAGDVVQPRCAALTSSLDHIDLIKSHEMPAGNDPVIYLVRDGRNATLSFLFMSFLFGGHQFSELGELDEAIRWLDRTEGCWSDHVTHALQRSERRAILFVRYEDLVARPESALHEMLHFLKFELPLPTVADCVRRHKQSDNYAENPYNGFLDQTGTSIYALLQQHRRGAYWRYIFDQRSKRYFHERGGTSSLLHFNYEHSPDWWRE
jgi:hypothetical protein